MAPLDPPLQSVDSDSWFQPYSSDPVATTLWRENQRSLRTMIGFKPSESQTPPEVFTSSGRRRVVLVSHATTNDVAVLSKLGFNFENNGVVAMFDTRRLVQTNNSRAAPQDERKFMALSTLSDKLGLNIPLKKYRPNRQTEAQQSFKFGHNAGVLAHYTLDCLLGLALGRISDDERQKPAPYPLQNPPMLVSVSTVEHEKDKSLLMEIGMSVIDLAAVRHVEPKDHCHNWLSQHRRSYHWIVKENCDKQNGDWIMDHRMKFPTQMGDSKTLPLADIPDAMRRAIFANVPPHLRPSPTTDLPKYRPINKSSVKIHLNEQGEIIRPFIDHDFPVTPVVVDWGDGEVDDFEEIEDGSEILQDVCAESLRGRKCKRQTSQPSTDPTGVIVQWNSPDQCHKQHICWDYAAERHCRHGDHGKHHDSLVHFKFTCPDLLKFANGLSQQPCRDIATCISGHDFQECRVWNEQRDRAIQRVVEIERRFEERMKQKAAQIPLSEDASTGCLKPLV